jgi:hypothetical protein
MIDLSYIIRLVFLEINTRRTAAHGRPQPSPCLRTNRTVHPLTVVCSHVLQANNAMSEAPNKYFRKLLSAKTFAKILPNVQFVLRTPDRQSSLWAAYADALFVAPEADPEVAHHLQKHGVPPWVSFFNIVVDRTAPLTPSHTTRPHPPDRTYPHRTTGTDGSPR